MTDTHPHKLILFGLAGSQAYGLAGPDSDEDMRGVFVYPTTDILGLGRFCGPQTTENKELDIVLHEVGKFVHLALAANPSILEQLFFEDYHELTAEGEMLVAARPYFLSQKIRQTYGGYATQQYKRLVQREQEGRVGFGPKTSKRREKHARHLARLLLQGQQLLATGELTLKLDKTQRKFVRRAERLNTFDLGELFADQMALLDAIDSPLPKETDYEAVNEILLDIRGMN